MRFPESCFLLFNTGGKVGRNADVAEVGAALGQLCPCLWQNLLNAGWYSVGFAEPPQSTPWAPSRPELR